MIADELEGLVEWEEAIVHNDLISGARRSFLLCRLPYWRNWAREPSHLKMYQSSD
jgi:hypothetical protein